MTTLLSFVQLLCGVALLTWVATRLARWLWVYIWLPLRPAAPRLANRYGAGSWALVTGAGDGLGKAFAHELAASGFNLILVSRTPSKLDRLKDELLALGIQVRTVPVDLSDTSARTFETLAEAARAVDLSILVNCVGTTVHRRFVDVPTETLRQLLAVNVGTTALATRTLLPRLLDHAASTGRRAALLNVGSIVGRFHWPGSQLYGACKAFIDHLSVPLAFEHRDVLDVLSFQPTVMATAMAAGTEPAAFIITPRQAARAALSQLGHTTSSHGHWRHGLLATLLSVIPAAVRNPLLLKSALAMGEVEMSKRG